MYIFVRRPIACVQQLSGNSRPWAFIWEGGAIIFARYSLNRVIIRRGLLFRGWVNILRFMVNIHTRIHAYNTH